MKIERYPNGMLEANTYLAYSDMKNAVVIDPSYEVHPVLRRIEELGLNCVYIINTHGHADHISGNSVIKNATSAEILIHENAKDALINPRSNLSISLPPIVESPPADKVLSDNEEILVDEDLKLKVLFTPGHCPGHICLLCEDNAFSGDLLFAGSIGRTDFPNCDIYQMRDSLRRINKEIPDDFNILPGHNETSIHLKEKESNYLYKRMIMGDIETW